MPLGTMPPATRRFPGSIVSVGLVLLLGACAAPGSDVHLAPVYTHLSTADGGTTVELAGGLYRHHRRASDGFLQWRTLAPLWGLDRERNGDWSSDHPMILGRTRRQGPELTSYVVPLWLGWRRQRTDGTTHSMLLTLPGFMRQRSGDRVRYGWFPLYGRLEDLLTFDEATFFLWPLYVENERSGRHSTHLLWPLFGWTTGGGERSWHVFPLIGRATLEGRYDRTYFLWPFFHWQSNHLGGGGEEPERRWWFFPFIGRSSRGTYVAWTWLWPFFGYAEDSRSGFWALDFLFPLGRFQRGPDDVERTRAWPLYSHLEAAGLRTTEWLWPLIWKRHEEDPRSERDTFNAFPFWQSSVALDRETGETSSWRRLWPLWRSESVGDWHKGALLDLDPMSRNDLVPRYLTGLLTLWDWETAPGMVRQRSFLGLWRRETGRGEDRRSLAGLWARRSYQDPAGPVTETSLLFGLLRWRSSADTGLDMLPPAFPGPGWPPPAEAGPLERSRSRF
jgi:hypothetical protein